MKINTKIKVTSLFLDLKPNTLLVTDGNAAGEVETKRADLVNRTNVFRFITRKNTTDKPSSFYYLNEYETIFYKELIRLLKVLDDNPGMEVYIDPIGRFKNDKWDIFHNIVQPKFLANFKNKDVTLLWDPKNIDKELNSYWGFLDVQGKYNVFNIDDPAVPFEHEFAKEYFDVKAYNKNHAKELMKEK